jgi:ribonuclease P/MRP protein subunit RPP40
MSLLCEMVCDFNYCPLNWTVANIYGIAKLRLELDRATYERCGLVGKVMSDHGRKHDKSRYGKPCGPNRKPLLAYAYQSAVIELDLRLPSMLHGKKGFDRILHAFKNVLNESHAWLFVDLDHADLSSGMCFKLLEEESYTQVN